MKTYVKMTTDNNGDWQWEKGEIGYIEGICKYDFAIVIGDRIIFAPFYAFKVIGLKA